MAEKNPLQWVEDQLNAEVRKRAAEKGVPLNVAAQEFIAELGPGFEIEVKKKGSTAADESLRRAAGAGGGRSPQAWVKCACPEWTDRVHCIDLRYHGYAPGPNSAQPSELRDECECVCHADHPDEDHDG